MYMYVICVYIYIYIYTYIYICLYIYIERERVSSLSGDSAAGLRERQLRLLGVPRPGGPKSTVFTTGVRTLRGCGH